VTVELKNDISIRGTLKSVDQYLNIKLDDITVLDELKYPHLSSVKNIFIRYVKALLSAANSSRLRETLCSRSWSGRVQWILRSGHSEETQRLTAARGSVVRYVHLPASEVDRGLLEDASRRGEPFSYLLCREMSLTMEQKPQIRLASRNKW
jgi:small nuclear ribonucleoprotein (snRNP)-like protein